jgi:hypothetical protein
MFKKTKERKLFEEIVCVRKDKDVFTFVIRGVSYRLDCKNNKFYSNLLGWDRSNTYRLSKEFKEKAVHKGRTDNHGGYYLVTTIHSCTIRIHRLVSFLFHGKCIFNNEIDHIDGNRENNKISNLKIVNRKENAKNAANRGAFKDVNLFSGKIKEQDIIDIKLLIKNGVKNIDIAKKYKVDPSNISRIKNNKWSSLRKMGF